MTRRTILLYWTLLLVPTLFISAAALQALRNEGDRLSRQADEALRERAASLERTIRSTVQGKEDEIMNALLRLPPAGRLG